MTDEQRIILHTLVSFGAFLFGKWMGRYLAVKESATLVDEDICRHGYTPGCDDCCKEWRVS